MTNFDRLQTMTRDRVRRLERRRDRLEAAGAYNPTTIEKQDALMDLMDVEDELDRLREQDRAEEIPLTDAFQREWRIV